MHALDELELTSPEDARRTVQIHEEAFAQAGQSDAFTGVIAAVVQLVWSSAAIMLSTTTAARLVP